MMDYLKGRKTYLVSIALFAFALMGLYLGKLSPEQATGIVLNAFGLAGLRNAIPASKK